MNDWLDYQGSGSSRAYIAHSKLFGKDNEQTKADANELKVNMKKDSTRSLTTYDPKTIFIPDELPSNVNQRIKQSYFDMPADEFIEHAVIEHGRFRDSMNNAIGKVMDKVTNADQRASDARKKQRQADERLKKAQIEQKAKELYDAASKLRGDAANYRAKLDNTWRSLADQEGRTKDPRALAQLESARRNVSNDIISMRNKIQPEISELYQELYKIEEMYNNFIYNNPTNYIKNVPSRLKDSKKYLDEATELIDRFITEANKNIW